MNEYEKKGVFEVPLTTTKRPKIEYPQKIVKEETMEKEVRFIKENIDKLYPKEAIWDLFHKEFEHHHGDKFEQYWEEAHKVKEEPKEEKEVKESLTHCLKDYKNEHCWMLIGVITRANGQISEVFKCTQCNKCMLNDLEEITRVDQ